MYLENNKNKYRCVKFFIERMGGIIENKGNATHFIVSKNKYEQLKQDMKTKNFKPTYILNLKFIFHTFYFMTKLNENDPEYRELF